MNSEPALKQLEMKFDTDLPKTQQVKKLMNDILNYVIGSESKMSMSRCLNRYKDLMSQHQDDKDDTMINHYIIQIEISFDQMGTHAKSGLKNLCSNTYNIYPTNKDRLTEMFIDFHKAVNLIFYEIHLIRSYITSLENSDRDDSPVSDGLLADIMRDSNQLITHIEVQHKITQSKISEALTGLGVKD